MAELAPATPPKRWSAAQTHAQYVAVAWLRWRIWLNGFRRKSGGGELVGNILTITIAVVLLIGPTFGAGSAAWYFGSQDQLKHLSFLLWGIFALSQLLNINLGQPGTTFDPTELIRFPMRLRHYVTIRLFFGLLAPANVMVVTTSLAIAAGLIIAIPTLWFYALLAMLIFAVTNILFTRMVFAWVDRWMSTRRAREIFTAFIFISSLGFQYLNATFNPAYSHHRHISSGRLAAAENLYRRADPLISALPPGLTTDALLSAAANRKVTALEEMAGCAAFGLLFSIVFTARTRTEFRGENLSDVANVVATKHLSRPMTPALAPARLSPDVQTRRLLGLSPVVFTIFSKEFLYLRRNTGLFYGLIAPMVMVFLFAGRIAARTTNAWLFPTALAYAMMGIAPLAYNSFGLEGAGTQFYFMAPIRLRDVFLGKNMMSFLLGITEIAAVLAILSYVATPPSLEMVSIGICWAFGTTLLNTSLGNLRSVSAPKKINLNRTSGKQASPLSALMSIGILLAAAGLAAGLLMLAHFFGWGWVVLPVMLIYAAVGLAVYVTNLKSMDRYTLNHRESMFEELCKR